jgi:competence protein ComFB
MSRVNQDTGSQSRVDLTALAYEGIKRVSHNQRPYFDHTNSKTDIPMDTPVFNIPTIMGRVFNGQNFSPMSDISVELRQNGKLAAMKDKNWQNPYILISSTGGTFTFLPRTMAAEATGVRCSFEYTIKIAASDFAELNHVFSIPVISELAGLRTPLSRTFKLPDLYLFSAGEEKDQRVITE